MAARPLIGSVLYKTIQVRGIESAVRQYHELKAKQPNAYDFSEDEFIGLGYRLIREKRDKEAIRCSIECGGIPAVLNTFDSLAEAYMDNGDKDLAIRNYERSLQLNPNNVNGIKMLEKLKAH